MKNDLPDVELYHRELLYNIELRCTIKAMKLKSPLSTLDHVDPIEDEDKEFTKSYIRSCGPTPER